MTTRANKSAITAIVARAARLAGVISFSFGFATALVVAVPAIDGVVLLAYWKWFLVGFVHIQAPSYPAAIALSFLARFLGQYPKLDDGEAPKSPPAKLAGLILFRAFFTLGLGFALHLMTI